ncbi:MAG: hypothetical protein HY078_01155 [Elusimicrobia bacterium]|nr:hypothetical protein [Elusimicrobiota bacterium]
MGAAALSIAAAALLNAGASRAVAPSLPPLAGTKPQREYAVQTAGLAGAGMRRLAADLSFIQLMMYYGSPEGAVHAAHEEHEGPPTSHADTGHYRQMYPRAKSILELDPFFRYAVLFSAGALAFNLNRPEEALRLLEDASRGDPAYVRYKAYIAGIAFHRGGGTQETVLRTLTPALADPDCPVLIKHIVAFLNLRLGHREEAIRLYREILLSKDASYRGLAMGALRRLGAPIPEEAK